MPVSPLRALRKPTRLRKYQLRPYAELVRGYEAYLAGGSSALGFEAPMGSGKTTTVRACAAWLLSDKRARLVVVAAPLNGVVEQWRGPAFFAEPPIVCAGSVQFPARLPTHDQVYGDVPVASASQLRDPKWWATATGFYVCTRQAMCTQASVDAMKTAKCNLQRVLAVGDEGHHHGDGTHAGAFFAALRARGAATLLVSGTPWHGSGSIFTTDTFVVRLSAASLAAEVNDTTGLPFMPRTWQAVKHVVGWTTSRAEYAVEGDDTSTKWAASYVEIMCRAVADEWARLGCPRTVVNVPGAAAWSKRLADEMRRAGTVVLGRAPVGVDLIGGMTDKVRAEAQARLRVDSEAHTWDHPARVHYVASCARMDEGTDWVPCSHVFNVRIPRSPLRVLQRWARASRGKHEIVGYPEQWKDVQTMVFFVPTLEGEAIEEAWRQHREHALLLAAYLADYEEARRWVQAEPVARGWQHAAARRKKRGDRLGAGDLSRGVGDRDPRGGSQLDRARVIAELVRRVSRAKNGAAKVADLDAALEKALPDVSHGARKAALLQLARGKDVEAVVAAARERAAKSTASGKPAVTVRSELAADLARIVEEFAHLVIRVPDELVACAVQFTALDAVAVSDRLRGLGRPPWDGMNLEEMQAFTRTAAAKWSARNGGKRPSNGAGRCDELNGYTWGGLDGALRILGASLAGTIGRQCNTYEQSAVAIKAFYENTGRLPSQSQGAIDSVENRLAQALVSLRFAAPALCQKYNIPLRADRSDAVRRGNGKHQFANVAEIVVLCVVHGNVTQKTKKVDNETGPLLDRLLNYTKSRPSASRGLGNTPDRCQINSIAKLMAEVRADCWKFTLDGSTGPDPREWAELLASGDHKRIASAERVAFLDWQDKRLRGGTRWTTDLLYSNLPSAVRRPWTPPATEA